MNSKQLYIKAGFCFAVVIAICILVGSLTWEWVLAMYAGAAFHDGLVTLRRAYKGKNDDQG